MSKKIIYTAIFGGYDQLPDPQYKPEGWDFICFTDSDIKSDIWEIKKVPAIYEDSTRNARKYKVLPHRWFPDYEYSLWVDGNILIKNNINELIDIYLDDNISLAVHDHNQNQLDPRDCVYDEAELILKAGQSWMEKAPERGILNWKDNPEVMKKQIEIYALLGYPQ